MSNLKILTLPEQVAEHLRQEIFRGRWQKKMPGRDSLARDLEVSPRSVRGALDILCKEGILVSRGPGMQSEIAVPERIQKTKLRINILLYDEEDRKRYYLVDLRHRLLKEGHAVEFSSKCMLAMRLDLERIKRFVFGIPSDAWIVIAGSYEILSWFSSLPIPVFALFGRYRTLPVAASGLKTPETVIHLTDRLVELGHRRIVMLTNEDRRRPVPGAAEQSFLNRLAYHGIDTGLYNLPDWHRSPEGISQLLDSLLKHTPPTALLMGEPALFFAVQDNLSRRGIFAPQHISLVSLDFSSEFVFQQPSISFLSWNSKAPIRNAVEWANNLALGKQDLRQRGVGVEFIEGGTVGRAPSGGF